MFGDGSTAQAQQWRQQSLALLWEGDVEAVLTKLRQLRVRSHAKREQVRHNLHYFANNAHRMRYGEFRRQGLHIGSGVVESACKHVAGARLKGAGMRWSLPGAQAILDLRLCLLNHTWGSYWQLPCAACLPTNFTCTRAGAPIRGANADTL